MSFFTPRREAELSLSHQSLTHAWRPSARNEAGKANRNDAALMEKLKGMPEPMAKIQAVNEYIHDRPDAVSDRSTAKLSLLRQAGFESEDLWQLLVAKKGPDGRYITHHIAGVNTENGLVILSDNGQDNSKLELVDRHTFFGPEEPGQAHRSGWSLLGAKDHDGRNIRFVDALNKAMPKRHIALNQQHRTLSFH